MKQVSNSDFDKILRLLYALSKTQGTCLKERENSRKAYLLHKKLTRKETKGNGNAISNTDKL